MTRFKATPYVPGSARGVLQRGAKAASPGNICLLEQSELAGLEVAPAGLIVVDGAPLSHPLIRFLVLGVPTVLIPSTTADALEPGREAMIDGLAGTIMLPPPGSAPEPPPEPPKAGEPLKLADGSTIELRASIHGHEEASAARRQGAAAIGLVRTEFIAPPDGRPPDAAFYRQELAALCEAARPLPVTLRLPDITLDKPASWLAPAARLNTPLGMQGIRLYDAEPVRSVIHAMLDAIDPLIDEFPLRLLLPNVTRLDEFLRWRDIIAQRLHRPVPTGAMAESPIAVLALTQWLEHADFVAIGCNDLMQCLFAADRNLAETSHYFDARSPELYRFLQSAAGAAGDACDRLQLCGLLPQQPGVLPVLVGMGFRNFSVAPVMIPYLAQAIAGIDLARAKALAREACEQSAL